MERITKPSIYNCIKNNKYPGIYLTKEVKDLYTKNYKTMIEKLEKEKLKDICAHGLEKIILLRY